MTGVPEFTLLSTNECPNAGPDWLYGNDCPPGGLTIFGWCGWCWQRGSVPLPWQRRVEAVTG